MRTFALTISLMTAVLLCNCAAQDDIYTLYNRLSALERRSLELEQQNREMARRNQELLETKKNMDGRVENMNQTRRKDELELRGKYASLAAEFDARREETKMLSGRLEEMEYLLNQKLKGFEDRQLKNGDRMDRLGADMAEIRKRLDIVEGYLNLEAGKAPKKVKTTASASSTMPMDTKSGASDQALYTQAKQLFDQGKMDAARQGFEKLIVAYPKSQQADNAQFWIGETYYQEKNYKKAILEYQKVIENYPAGNKIPAPLCSSKGSPF